MTAPTYDRTFFLHRLSCVTRQVHLQHLSIVSFTHAEKMQKLMNFQLGYHAKYLLFLAFLKKNESTHVRKRKQILQMQFLIQFLSLTYPSPILK